MFPLCLYKQLCFLFQSFFSHSFNYKFLLCLCSTCRAGFPSKDFHSTFSQLLHCLVQLVLTVGFPSFGGSGSHKKLQRQAETHGQLASTKPVMYALGQIHKYIRNLRSVYIFFLAIYCVFKPFSLFPLLFSGPNPHRRCSLAVLLPVKSPPLCRHCRHFHWQFPKRASGATYSLIPLFVFINAIPLDG